MLYRALYKSAKECYATFRSGLVGRSNCTITYIYYSLSIFCSIYHGILQMHLTCRIYQLLLSTSKVDLAREILLAKSTFVYPSLAISPLNSQVGGTAMAQLNLSRRVFEKIFSMGTSFLLHQATEMRGSM